MDVQHELAQSAEKRIPQKFDKVPVEFPRRKVLMGAAWSVPVIALAISAPAAAASETPEQSCDPMAYIASGHDSFYGVQPTETGFIVLTRFDGPGNAIDITVRIGGVEVYHKNWVTQGKNPGDNQELYTRGQNIVITVGKNLKLSDGDFMQVADTHLHC